MPFPRQRHKGVRSSFHLYVRKANMNMMQPQVLTKYTQYSSILLPCSKEISCLPNGKRSIIAITSNSWLVSAMQSSSVAHDTLFRIVNCLSNELDKTIHYVYCIGIIIRKKRSFGTKLASCVLLNNPYTFFCKEQINNIFSSITNKKHKT